MGTARAGKDVRVRILYVEGCANTSPTVDVVKNAAQDLNIQVNIEMVMIATQEQAHELRFLGSPTVQIEGFDIELSARDSVVFGLT